MTTHEVGKCYKMLFDDGEEITFRFLGPGPQGPIVEVNGHRKNLHKLMAGHTLKHETAVPCEPDDLTQSLDEILDRLSRTEGSLDSIHESDISGQESEISSVQAAAMSALERIAVLKGNHGAIPMTIIDAESKLKSMMLAAKKVSTTKDPEIRTQEFRRVEEDLSNAMNGIAEGINELRSLKNA